MLIRLSALRAMAALLLGAVLLVAAPAAARAPLCHAAAPDGAPLAAAQVAALPFSCGPVSEDFRDRWLWIRLTPPRDGVERNLIVQPTRVDRVRVVSLYADGTSSADEIRAGDYGDHWSMDNRVTFDLPDLPAPIVAVYVGAEHLRFERGLDPRLVEAAHARYTSALTAMLIGAALSLLFASFLYNCFRLVAQRQTVLAGHAMWALLTFVWGLLWSQAILGIFPALAGTWSARLGTVMAAGAITAATALFAAAVEPDLLSRRTRRAIVAVGAVPLLVALGTTFELGRYTGVMFAAVNGTAMLPVAVVTVFAGLTIRRGSRAAFEFAFAWLIPMAAVIASTVADVSLIPGVTGQMSVLVASALQTILLSMTMTMKVAEVRAERDRARAQGAEYRQLALTDVMTSLSNRRGFVQAVERMLGARRPVGLILLDLDHFKAINDGFGHVAGDEVLARLGAVLADLCPAGGVAGRLGGEEFGIAAPGLTGAELATQAEGVRRSVASMMVADLLAERQLTCSVGVSDSPSVERGTFDDLFRAADNALYDAKRRGRDRVVVHGIKGPRALSL